MSSFEEQLRRSIEGDVCFDEMTRKVYSVDASIYEIEPIGIVVPKTAQDVVAAVSIAHERKIPVIPRGAATGITGGCLGQGLIIDTSKYLTNISIEDGFAICEPGVIQDALNHAAAPFGLRLGPDTSTGNRATLGGMVGNNSAGARSLKFGKMVDHVEELEMVLASGKFFEPNHFSPLFASLQKEYGEEIEKRFPKIPRRVSGYNLDQLSNHPCKMIVGSEGSLGIVTKVRMKLVPKLGKTFLLVIHFSDMISGMEVIPDILRFNPIALEMIDHRILAAAKKRLSWLDGDPEALFIAEFEEENGLEAWLRTHKIGYAYTTLRDHSAQDELWTMRKSGLGLLLSKQSFSRAIAFVEDISVAPAELAPFMQEFNALLKQHGKEAGIYGHVGSGCIHIRPYIDLRSPDERQEMVAIMEEVSNLVLRYGGALSGEHGDGLVRSWTNEKMFGEKLYQAFREIKTAFDPDNLMNPGKVIASQGLLENIRESPKVEPETFLKFDGGLLLSVDLCNGNAQCRKGETLMCPSFQATHNEYDTTRARAQALRTAMRGEFPLTSHEVYDVLDLCLECKGCKSECPSHIDMAKMKAEFLYQYQEKHGYSLRSRLFGHFDLLTRWMGFATDWRLTQFLMKKIGIARALPKPAKRRFSDDYKNAKGDVVLILDSYTEFYNPEVGKAAVAVLEQLGYQVIVPPWNCCGRPAFSKGLLPRAKKLGNALVDTLRPYAEANLPLIGLEPSCLFMIQDDYKGLLGETLPVTLFDSFVAKHLDKLHLKPYLKPILVHTHCHQKALLGSADTLAILHAIPGIQVHEIPSGCCGMAGSFGYETEHQEISRAIASLKLLPALSGDSTIISNGFSCRHQIMHFTPYKPLHLAELLSQVMKYPLS